VGTKDSNSAEHDLKLNAAARTSCAFLSRNMETFIIIIIIIIIWSPFLIFSRRFLYCIVFNIYYCAAHNIIGVQCDKCSIVRVIQIGKHDLFVLGFGIIHVTAWYFWNGRTNRKSAEHTRYFTCDSNVEKNSENNIELL